MGGADTGMARHIYPIILDIEWRFEIPIYCETPYSSNYSCYTPIILIWHALFVQLFVLHANLTINFDMAYSLNLLMKHATLTMYFGVRYCTVLIQKYLCCMPF